MTRQLEQLQHAKQDVEANVALGKATPEASAKLGDEIMKKRTEIASIRKTTEATVGKAKEAIEGLRRQEVEADASAKKLKAQQYEVSAAFVLSELEAEAEIFVTKANGARGVLESWQRMTGLNTLLKQLAHRHRVEDRFSIDLRGDQFSIPWIVSLASFRAAGQRPDHALFNGLFGDTPGRTIDGPALAERERLRFHELGLTIL